MGGVSPPEGPPLLSIMGDLCGMRHDRLDVSPERGKFENPACASGDDIDLAYKKPNVLARVGTYPWDDKKSPRGAVSSDGGITWKQFGSEPAGSAGSGSIAVSADGAVVLWAPRDARAAYSRDGGATWVTAAGLPDPVKVPDWGPWFLRLAAFFRSDDGGESFVRINDDQHQYGGSHVITGDPRVYGRVYLGPLGAARPRDRIRRTEVATARSRSELVSSRTAR